MLQLILNRLHLAHWKTLIFILLMCQNPVSFAADLHPPKLTYEYGSVLDLQCESITQLYFQHRITPGFDHHTQIMKDASSLTPVLQKQWDRQGPQLLSALINLVGREYSKDELVVYTSGCQSGGMSTPLIVGVKLYLKSVRKNPLSTSHIISITFHEFIHKYLSESFDYGRSEVLKEFSQAPALFKNHVHLMALMKRSMTLAKREDLIRQYAKTLRGVYKKAWDMSTSKDYQERLINEVRTLKGDNKNYWFFGPLGSLMSQPSFAETMLEQSDESNKT